MFQLLCANCEKFENGELKALVPRIAFSFGRAKKIAKNPRCAFRTSISRSGAVAFASVRRWTFRGRRSHARNVYVPRKSGEGGRDGGGGCRERRGRRWDWNCKYPSSPSLRVSTVSPIYLPATPSTVRPLALTPERVRYIGAYRRACFKESSPDDKSPDFAGFKFVTVLNCDASASLLLPSS